MDILDKRRSREMERQRVNREAILHAAETVIRRKGLEAASMDEVAREAGFSKPTIYRYVRTKAALVFELIIHYLEDVDARLKTILVRPLDPRQKLLETLRSLVQFQSEKEGLTRFFLTDRSFMKISHSFVASPAGHGQEKEREFLLRIEAALREITGDLEALFREGISCRAFRDIEPGRAVLFLQAVVLGSAHERFIDDRKPNLEKDVNDIYGFILHGIERWENPEGATS